MSAKVSRRFAVFVFVKRRPGLQDSPFERNRTERARRHDTEFWYGT